MKSNQSARTRLVAAVVLSVSVLLAGCSDDGNDGDATTTTVVDAVTTTSIPGASTAPTTPTTVAGTTIAIDFAGGKVTTADTRPVIQRGEVVRLEVRSDVADEVHLHGYDKTAAVTPGAPAVVTFTADIPGVFEAELHHAHKRLISLEIKG